ncbi:MAG: hypothetical protein JXO72_15615 [Vicinamibacteria bacterium]|nr:hypothetical protein [Vicinamibacteria bacterium]
MVPSNASNTSTAVSRIDRHAVVERHNPRITRLDPDAPLSVGNGRFAFTVDVTGLQTFPAAYREQGIPLETQARWAWHSNPNPNGYQLKDTYRLFDEHGRKVGYPTDQAGSAGQWLRRNPHVLPLAQIGFDLRDANGAAVEAHGLSRIEQTLDLWRGIVTSAYAVGDQPVTVVTACHPRLDLIAVRVESRLLREGRLRIKLAFPFTHDLSRKLTPGIDWSRPERHSTEMARPSARRADFVRTLDDTRYFTVLAWGGKASIEETKRHHFLLTPARDGERLEFILAFGAGPLSDALPSIDATMEASGEWWRDFWSSGGAIDLAASRDARAYELERRVVLSRYLTAIQLNSDVPPQESGLTCSTWYGKHHAEMVFWHLAHFALWGWDEPVEKTLRWFESRLPAARALAQERGLRGARWSKMVGPDMRESPGGNPLIIWNQPHPIYLAELLYRNQPRPETLERHRAVVLETAEAMAAYTHWDGRRYVLGPPLWIAQEIYDQATSQNPSFELSYWAFGLDLAQKWRRRLGLARSPDWDRIIDHLAPLPVKNGLYVALESHPDTFDNINSRRDHPTMLAPIGLLPGYLADAATMSRTLDAVLAAWDWKAKIWGWDYPMIAMTAARLGRPGIAVDILLRDAPNNHYTASGHCPQDGDIAVYLPANGSLLTAVALLAAGWDGTPNADAPGFPKNGDWTVRWEGLRPLP